MSAVAFSLKIISRGSPTAPVVEFPLLPGVSFVLAKRPELICSRLVLVTIAFLILSFNFLLPQFSLSF